MNMMLLAEQDLNVCMPNGMECKSTISCLLVGCPVITHYLSFASALGDNLDITLVPGYNYNNFHDCVIRLV